MGLGEHKGNSVQLCKVALQKKVCVCVHMHVQVLMSTRKVRV